MGDPMLFTKLIVSYHNRLKNAEMRHNMRMAMENPSDNFLVTNSPPDAPEWVHLYWMAQNEICMEKHTIENKTHVKDCALQNQIARERKSLSYEIHLQRSYLHYARKELPYEEVQEIEARYKELKNLYWRLFGCML